MRLQNPLLSISMFRFGTVPNGVRIPPKGFQARGLTRIPQASLASISFPLRLPPISQNVTSAAISFLVQLRITPIDTHRILLPPLTSQVFLNLGHLFHPLIKPKNALVTLICLQPPHRLRKRKLHPIQTPDKIGSMLHVPAQRLDYVGFAGLLVISAGSELALVRFHA